MIRVRIEAVHSGGSIEIEENYPSSPVEAEAFIRALQRTVAIAQERAECAIAVKRKRARS